jgi:hypothetical protein
MAISSMNFGINSKSRTMILKKLISLGRN